VPVIREVEKKVFVENVINKPVIEYQDQPYEVIKEVKVPQVQVVEKEVM
jgi:hypothetical protein